MFWTECWSMWVSNQCLTSTDTVGSFSFFYAPPGIVFWSGSWGQTQKSHNSRQPRWHLHSLVCSRHDWPLYHPYQVWGGWDSLLALPYPCSAHRWCQQVYSNRWECSVGFLILGCQRVSKPRWNNATPAPHTDCFCRAHPATLLTQCGEGNAVLHMLFLIVHCSVWFLSHSDYPCSLPFHLSVDWRSWAR